MSNVSTITEGRAPSIDEIEREALEQVRKESMTKAKNALVLKYRELDGAKRIVSNIEREIADLKASIEDGSFVG